SLSQNASTAAASVRSTSSRSATTTSSPRARSSSAIARPSAPAPPQTRATSATDELQELAPQLGVFLERTAPERRHGARVLLDASHLRAEVRRFELDGDAFGLDQLDQRVGDLLAEPLLHGEAARVEPHEAGQLRDA